MGKGKVIDGLGNCMRSVDNPPNEKFPHDTEIIQLDFATRR